MTKITRDEFICRTKAELRKRKRRQEVDYMSYHIAVLDKQKKRSNT